jgi:YesN/AraC family two-component response regulator
MEIDEAMDCGMDDILHKPYKREELEAMLKKWGRKLSVH